MPKNTNVATINAYNDNNDILSNITINNTIRIPQTAINTDNVNDNNNAGIFLKDVNSASSGEFYRLHVDSLTTHDPHIYFNNNEIIDSSNLLSELEIELVTNNHTLDTSNITVKGGYINFFNGSNANINQGSNGVGLRYSSNNTVQFKNADTNWIDLVDITRHDEFKELVDVDVYTNPLMNNQYITYNATSNHFVNSNLAIINDTNPRLGGNLVIGTKLLEFSNGTNRLVTSSALQNNLITLKNNAIYPNTSNYLEFNNADITGNTSPSIIAKGTTMTDVGLIISTSGTGDIHLNSTQGNIYTNSDSLIVSGFVTSSIYRSSSSVGYIPNTTFTVPLTNDTILFDFKNGDGKQSGTYWANVNAGVDGQKLNLIYNNRGSNIISMLVNCGSNGIITGTGYSNGLVFTASGQSSTLIYLGDGTIGDINAWQVLNTGSGLF